MPSRRLLSPPPPPPSEAGINHRLSPATGAITAAFSCLLLLSLCFRRFSKKRTAPAAASDTDSKKPPHRLSYSLLQRATSNFSPSHRIGRGGFGSVYRGDLKKDSPFPSSLVAVKLMDSGSSHGEREFQNELIFSSKTDCKYIVSVLGFSSNPGKRRTLLIYELMERGSLQDCLFHMKSEELRNWEKRFSIALNVGRGLEYLHHHCDPPIIHGDVKPSNILLDVGFNAKIGDFGLARFKVEGNVIVEGEAKGDNVSVMEDTESVITIDEVNNEHYLDSSPQSVVVRVETSPEAESGPIVSPRTVAKMASPFDGLDKVSVEGGGERIGWKTKSNKKKKSVSGKDWWWKQDSVGAEGDSGKVKDYVMEWLGTEIKKERPKSEWIGGASSSSSTKTDKKNKKKRRQMDWWVALEKENTRRPAREWWKEEHCEELQRKKRKNKGHGTMSDHEQMYADRKKKRNHSRSSSIDWLDSLSGDLRKAKSNNCHDSFITGEIPKSGGISSTPSMRGTVCYIAPEYGGGGSEVSEKCDIYSFGVLLLVLIAGRRPLEVTGSPMSEFKRANLLSWARHLARAGKLLDLVDQRMTGGGGFLDREQALMCITVALLCLQKSPNKRPSMKEVVGMLCGDLPAPQLPVEYSPSPQGRFKAQRKVAR